MNINKTVCLLLLTVFSIQVFAQGVPNKLTKKEVNEIIKSVTQLINAKYVYPDKAKKITDLLNKNHNRGEYKKGGFQLQVQRANI